MNKVVNIVITVLVVSIFIATVVVISTAKPKNSHKVIKDPVIIYDNLKIEPMDTRGVFGVISEKDLKEFLEFKRYELLTSKKGKNEK